MNARWQSTAIRRDDHAFDKLVRIAFKDHAILAGSGFALIGVATQVDRFTRCPLEQSSISFQLEIRRRRGRAVREAFVVSITSCGVSSVYNFSSGRVTAQLDIAIDLLQPSGHECS